MMAEPARALHDNLRHRIRDGAPRQIMIDDCWIGLTKEQRFVTSSDGGYHFGCWKSGGESWELDAMHSGLARRLALMLDNAVRATHALDYRGKRCGEIKLK